MVRRTTIFVDDEKVKLAQQALGTSGLKDTIDAALDEAIRSRLLKNLSERIRTQQGIDFTEEVLSASKAQ